MSEIFTIPVPLNKTIDHSYRIHIERGSLAGLGDKLRNLGLGQKSDRVLVVTNPVVDRHYGRQAEESLRSAGFQSATVVIAGGERYKNPQGLQKIWDSAYGHRLERHSLMIALGGGVVGDMTGFASACWLRGIDFIQVPTTLLAMVDASIGGKTGVNHRQGKNLIGAFHQPRLVLIDPQLLKTLPAREIRAGMAEVIKYGVIWDQQLWALLQSAKSLDRYTSIDPDLLLRIICRCAQTKAEIVAQDEKEAGIRAILNYGHTVGHAIEAITNYKLLNHGEAIAVGMTWAGWVARSMGWWTPQEYDQQQDILGKTKLPVSIPTCDHQELYLALTMDKKVSGGKIKFILPRAVGRVEITDQVSQELIYQGFQHIMQAGDSL